MNHPEIRISGNITNINVLLGLATGALKNWGHEADGIALREAVAACDSYEEKLAAIKEAITLEIIDPQAKDDPLGAGAVSEERAGDDEALAALATPALWTTVSAIENDPKLVPAVAGVYGWWFDGAPPGVPTEGAIRRNGRYWLYVGIAGGREGAKRTLRRRLTNHAKGPVRVSTLRRTLAALLREELGLEIHRSASGKMLLGPGDERRLTSWMDVHMRVAWITHDQPSRLEERLLRSQPGFALNILGSIHSFAGELRRRRAAAFPGRRPAGRSRKG